MADDFHKQKTLPDLHTEQSRFPLPEKIGPYKIESLLNKGGMSLLYLGIHPETGQPIVIKILLPKYLKHKEMAQRFLKEAQIIGMAHHPNIVRLYGQGQWEKGLYIAMEFIQGISLRQFIQQKSLTQRRALAIIIQVAYALCHLHTHGVIHRDLKPENILITETGAIKVIDFGIAQLHGELPPDRITQRKRMMGTPTYMSPEQKEHPHQVSYASDIYSLGIIAYELLLGRLSHGVIHLALLPRRLRAIIEKALQPDVKDRYQDIIEFINDISQYMRTLSEEPTESEEEISEEVLNLIHHTRQILTPKTAPKWPQIEIGIALRESPNSLYLDFFHLSGNRYIILLAEPLTPGISSLFQTAIFRGMMRMALQPDSQPLQKLQILNQHQDLLNQPFALSFLLLNPDKDQLTFLSCQGSDLWHLPQGSQTLRALTAPNPPLGSDPSTPLLETTDNWNAGDTLILPSPGIVSQDPSWILEYTLLSPQPQATQLLQKLPTSPKTSALLTLQRMF